MAKRRRIRSYGGRLRRRFRRAKDRRIALLPTLAGLVPAFEAYQHLGSPQAVMADPMGFGKQLVYEYTGYDVNANSFDIQRLVRVGMMIGAGYLGHKIANYAGVNRQIAKVPLIGKHISL